MRQLLQNLIAQRAQVPPRRACRRSSDVDRRARDGRAWPRSSVADNGIGFERAVRRTASSASFERLHPRDDYEGTGIGLAICRKIAERHGGTITADGTPGEGATFTVTLPLEQRRRHRRPPATPTRRRPREPMPMPDSRKPITILLADDDDGRPRCSPARRSRRARLPTTCASSRTARSCSTTCTASGEYADAGATRRARADPARPQHAAKDGREALREIKADPDLRSIPVVVLTTSKAEEDIFRTYDLGVNSFITKPVTFDGLVEVMQTFSRYWFEIVELPPEARWTDRRADAVRRPLVEDDEDDYVITRDLLARAGARAFELDWVATLRGRRCEQIEQRRHDVYLVDYRLGEHDRPRAARATLARRARTRR